MNNNTETEVAKRLLEELIIAEGLIREICDIKKITPPGASLRRMQKAIKDASDIINK
ncbi:hypothetical protein [Morganella morganii]|uniref:hypothetical protein n=1 Tax=Morganella morganii TaxID=582 RepID=UPI0034E5BB67